MKKSIYSILVVFLVSIIGMIEINRKMKLKYIKEREMSNKHLSLFLMMNQWVRIKQEGKNISSYFNTRGYYKIAIYGMSYAGQTLLEELKGTDIKVIYGIDKKAEDIYTDFEIVQPNDRLMQVDAIVVTSIKFFDEVKRQLSQRLSCPIVSLEDILYEL